MQRYGRILVNDEDVGLLSFADWAESGKRDVKLQQRQVVFVTFSMAGNEEVIDSLIIAHHYGFLSDVELLCLEQEQMTNISRITRTGNTALSIGISMMNIHARP